MTNTYLLENPDQFFTDVSRHPTLLGSSVAKARTAGVTFAGNWATQQECSEILMPWRIQQRAAGPAGRWFNRIPASTRIWGTERSRIPQAAANRCSSERLRGRSCARVGLERSGSELQRGVRCGQAKNRVGSLTIFPEAGFAELDRMLLE